MHNEEQEVELSETAPVVTAEDIKVFQDSNGRYYQATEALSRNDSLVLFPSDTIIAHAAKVSSGVPLVEPPEITPPISPELSVSETVEDTHQTSSQEVGAVGDGTSGSQTETTGSSVQTDSNTSGTTTGTTTTETLQSTTTGTTTTGADTTSGGSGAGI